MERAVGAEPHQPSAALLLSLAVNEKSVLRGGGTHQPLKVEQRDRLTGHKTKQFASRGGSEAAKRNVFFHTFFFFPIPPIKFSAAVPVKMQLQQQVCQCRVITGRF